MRRFAGFMIFMVAIFVIMALLSLLLPSKVTVTKSVQIHASAEKVRDQILDFSQWKNWYPAYKNKQITVTRSRGLVTLRDREGREIRLVLTDSGRNVLVIHLESDASARVDYQFIITPKINDQVQLTWNVNTDLGWYPWKRVRGIFLDQFSGPVYEEALESLKKAAEN